MMKHAVLCLSLFCASSLTMSHAKSINEDSSVAQKVGYSFGYLMGRSSSDNLENLDLDAFLQGFRTAIEQKPALLSEEQMAAILNDYKKQNEANEIRELQQIATKNAQIEKEFLAQNAKKADVQRTASGLQYQVLQQGQGKRPKANSRVQVHYEGRLLDDTVFDSSIARGEALEFELSQVIHGWVEALQLMQEGAKYRLFVPSKLAYGEMGSGDRIEPNSTLIFELELIKVLP